MAVVTIYRLAEECFRLIEGGNPAVASSISINELKIACGQVINQLLKVEYLQINSKIGEVIPNGSVLGLYTVPVTKYKDRSQASLPIKPIKLPRNMGVFSIFPEDEPDKEFIPLQMGQYSLIRSQVGFNDLLGQVGYEVYGDKVIFTKDLTIPRETVNVNMRLVVMDIAAYGDFDILPILPEMEIQVKQEVYKLYISQSIPDKVVDSTVKENKNIPLKEQSQS